MVPISRQLHVISVSHGEKTPSRLAAFFRQKLSEGRDCHVFLLLSPCAVFTVLKHASAQVMTVPVCEVNALHKDAVHMSPKICFW